LLSTHCRRSHLHYWIYNGGKSPILIFNRLWTGASKPEADTQKIYRFVASDSLHLLLGKAPLPRFPVTFRNVPEVTKLSSGAGFEEEIAVPIPVTEYSVYFGDAGIKAHSKSQITRGQLFVEYVIDAGGIELVPSSVHPGAWLTTNAKALIGHQTLRTTDIPLQADVLRHTDDFSRL
jgi:hypothetical protein